MRSNLSQKSLHLSPVLAYDFLSRSKFSTPSSTPLYSSINRLYAQSPVFAIIHDESVKVYLHMYNGNVQQNPLCVESCVTKEFSISPRLWRTIFDPNANSVLLRAHLCTAVDFIFIFFFTLTYSRWTSSLPSCLWSLRIFPSLPGSYAQKTLCSKLFKRA